MARSQGERALPPEKKSGEICFVKNLKTLKGGSLSVSVNFEPTVVKTGEVVGAYPPLKKGKFCAFITISAGPRAC